VGEFWNTLEEIQAQKNAHAKSYKRITGEQSFMERMMTAAALDTGVGQIAQSLIYRFENDGFRPPEVEGFNPIDDGDLEGYDQWLEEFITATSPKEVEMRKLMIDRNIEHRTNLENHGFARLMGNLIDPINLIPIPLAKGLGFVGGFKRGALGVAGPFAVSETVRADIDPTNHPLEPVLAIAGGALFGGAIGGLVGSMKPGTMRLAGKRWFETHNNGLDAYNRLQEVDDTLLDGVKPFVEIKEGQSRISHLKEFVEKTGRETDADYNARLELIAGDDKIYSDLSDAAKLWDPDQFLSTGIGIEGWRLSQHPYFMLKNTTFGGQLGNIFRRVADRISGPPGMMTKGATVGVAQAQGVFNKATLLNVHVMEAKSGLYNSYKRFSGVMADDAVDMTAGRQVVSSIFDTVKFQGKHYAQFLDDVSRLYISGGTHADPNMTAAVGHLKKYYDTMGELGNEAGVFGIRRLEKEAKYLAEVHLPRSREFIRKYMDGDPDAPNEAFQLGEIGRLKRDYEAFDSLEAQWGEKGSLTKAQMKYHRDLQKAIPEREAKIKELNSFLKDEDGFIGAIRAEGSEPKFANQFLKNVVKRRRKLDDTNLRIEEFRNTSVKNPDEMSHGHFPRFWNQQAIRENRDELVKILEDWYGKDAGAVKRAEATVDSILKEHDPGLVKRTLREGLEATGADPQAIRVMERKVDDIFSRKKPKKTDATAFRNAQRADARALMKEYMENYGFGDDIKAQVAEALSEIERISASGHPEGFGAAMSTFERVLDIPSAFLIRGEGRSRGIASVDFIEVNPESVMRAYHRRMSASIEMTHEFGDPTMRNFMEELSDQIDELAEAAGGVTKEADEIRAEGKLQLQAMQDLSQKVLGVYNIPADPGSIGNRSVRAIKNFMVLALMGKPAIAALADVGRGVMSVGAKQAFEGAFAKFSHGIEDFKIAGAMVNEAGEAGEMAIHGRFEAMFDLEGFVTSQNAFEKMLESGVNKMFILNGLMPYTDMMKRFFGSLIQSQMIKSSLAWAGDAHFERSTVNSLFHGSNLRDGRTLENFIDLDGNLRLKASSNFEGRQVGVSLTDVEESARDYAARIKGGGPFGISKRDAIVFEIDRASIKEDIIDEAMNEKFIALDEGGEIVIPKGSFKVHNFADDFEALNAFSSKTAEEMVERFGSDTSKLSDDQIKELFEISVKDVEAAEMAEHTRFFESTEKLNQESIDIVNAFGSDPELAIRAEFANNLLRKIVKSSDEWKADLHLVDSGYETEQELFDRILNGLMDDFDVRDPMGLIGFSSSETKGLDISAVEIPSKYQEAIGEIVIKGKAGKISERDMTDLTRNGIGFEDAVRIAQEYAKHGKQGDALHLANVGAWDDPVIQKTFRTALVQEINNAVITPGPAERLNFMSTPIGALMTQFKSFAFSATYRTLLAGLQQRDAKALHGIMAMIAMGYLVDRIKSPSYDQRDLLSIDRFVQAVDYSGATGILFDVDNMIEVISGNEVGLRPLLGVDSFFKDPNLAQRTGQIGGPAASLGFDLLHTIFSPEATGSDYARSVRRLMPFNNLIWWSGLVDQLQRSVGADLEKDDE